MLPAVEFQVLSAFHYQSKKTLQMSQAENRKYVFSRLNAQPSGKPGISDPKWIEQQVTLTHSEASLSDILL